MSDPVKAEAIEQKATVAVDEPMLPEADLQPDANEEPIQTGDAPLSASDDVKVDVKSARELPKVEGLDDEAVEALLAKAAKQGTSPLRSLDSFLSYSLTSALQCTSTFPTPKLRSRVCRLCHLRITSELFNDARPSVYFYFSDSNLPIDRYFFSLTACNKEGWVPIKTIMTFKRMREFEIRGVAFVTLALREAAAAEGNDPLIAISEDGENVRRKRPLEPNTTAWSRSVYVVSRSSTFHDFQITHGTERLPRRR